MIRLDTVALAMAICVAVCSIGACSPSSELRPAQSLTSAASAEPSTPTTNSANLDISRIANIENAFPSGLIPNVVPLQHNGADRSSKYGRVLGMTPSEVDPGQCKPGLQVISASDGYDWIGLQAHQQSGPQAFVGAIRAAEPFVVSQASAGCDRVSYKADREQGTVEVVAAPVIEGVTTRAYKIQYDGELGSGVRYYYAAILSDRVFIDIRGVLEPSSQTEQAFSDLLSRAVAAVQGV
jgi:hypothetical protein